MTEEVSDGGAEVGKTGTRLGAVQAIRDFDSVRPAKCLNRVKSVPGQVLIDHHPVP